MQKKLKNTKKNTDTLLVNPETGESLMPLTSEQLGAIVTFLAKELAKKRATMKLDILKKGLLEYLKNKGFNPKNPKD